MLKFRNISKEYRMHSGGVLALNNVSLDIPDSKMIAIAGKSGSGKSTLLRLIGGFDDASDASIVYNICGKEKDITMLSERTL